MTVGAEGPGPAAHVDFSHTVEARRVQQHGHVNGAEAAYDSSDDEGTTGSDAGEAGVAKSASAGPFIADNVCDCPV